MEKQASVAALLQPPVTVLLVCIYLIIAISSTCQIINLLFYQVDISSTCHCITPLVLSPTCSFFNLPFH
jgi:hypothetical protein